MKSNFKKTISVFLLVCFIVSLTATSATATTYTKGMGLKDPNNPNSVNDHNVIMKYQACLYVLGYLDSYSVNGYYGPETTDAVTLFQDDHNIQATGDIGGKTDRALKSECMKSMAGKNAWYHNWATFDEGVERLDQVLSVVSPLVGPIVSALTK